MPRLVIGTAVLKCSFGTATSVFQVAPHQQTSGARQPMATIQDYKTNQNIKPFALCTSPANPQVASKKAPQPCVPIVTAPWAPGSPAVNIDRQPVLTADSTCLCQWGGTIQITAAGQETVNAGGQVRQAAAAGGRARRGRRWAPTSKV